MVLAQKAPNSTKLFSGFKSRGGGLDYFEIGLGEGQGKVFQNYLFVGVCLRTYAWEKKD